MKNKTEIKIILDKCALKFSGGAWYNYLLTCEGETIGTACMVFPDDGECDKKSGKSPEWGQLICGYGGDEVDEDEYADFDLADYEDEARRLAASSV